MRIKVTSVFDAKESYLFKKIYGLSVFLSIIGQLGVNNSFYLIYVGSTTFLNHFQTKCINKTDLRLKS